MKYFKPWLSVAEQVLLLEARGLEIENTASVKHFLLNVSYSRLSEYFSPFQKEIEYFDSGTTFKSIQMLYSFDRELKLIVFDAIERIEIAVRTQIVYCMSGKYGPYWMTNPDVFKNNYKDKSGTISNYSSVLLQSMNAILKKKTREESISIFLKKYTDENYPPSWIIIEQMTFGDLSYTYKYIAGGSDKKQIASYFSLPPDIFESWLHSLNYVRNLCGHHSRLWNRELAIDPAVLITKKYKSTPWLKGPINYQKRIYYSLCTMKYLLNTINPGGHFRQRIENLFAKYPTVPIRYMGIPSVGRNSNTLIDWQNEPVWQA
ncbi:MAG: Abi family protein [Bacteroidota bacterium]